MWNERCCRFTWEPFCTEPEVNLLSHLTPANSYGTLNNQKMHLIKQVASFEIKSTFLDGNSRTVATHVLSSGAKSRGHSNPGPPLPANHAQPNTSHIGGENQGHIFTRFVFPTACTQISPPGCKPRLPPCCAASILTSVPRFPFFLLAR